MRSPGNKLLRALGILLAAAGALGWFALTCIAPIGSAYTAKRLCSGVFVSHREPSSIWNEDLGRYHYIDSEINYVEKAVTASVFGMAKRTALYREGLGSTLVIGTTQAQLQLQAAGYAKPLSATRDDLPWPDGDLLPTSGSAAVDMGRLLRVMEAAFSETGPGSLRRTRAVVVVYDGSIIAERYAPGITQETPLLGWSMTKSAINALAGILVKEGKLSLKGPCPVPEWKGPGDPRGAITVDHLLHMSSGLKFTEDYEYPLSDVVVMLFAKPDAAAYAAENPLEAEPDSAWQYSSGTTNIISRMIRHALATTDAGYFAFPRRVLFDRIGMTTAIIEPDASGTFTGSSFMYASARDWARLGLLYLEDGVWNGRRILPQGWVTYSTTPAPKAPQGKYGAHFWLNAGTKGNTNDRWMPRVPADMYSMCGFEGQFVTIIPSKKLVIVRLGLSEPEELWDHEGFVASIIEALSR